MSHTFHANRGWHWSWLNMFATLATGTFRNSPWYLGQGNSLTTLFSEDNLTTMSRRGAVTLMIAMQSPKNWYQTRPQTVITVTVIRDVCPHHNATRGMPYQKMESQRIEYRAYVRRRPTIKCWYAEQPTGCTDATRIWTRPRLRSHPWHPGWAVIRLTVSASGLAAATFQLPRFFPRVICNWDYWKHPLALTSLFFLCTTGFWSYFTVIAHNA